MKAANKCIRKKDREGFLRMEHATPEIWDKLNTPDCFGGIGYPDYKLRNNNQNIARLKKRLAQQRQNDARETVEKVVKGVTYIENVEANRVQLIFPGVPAKEVRERLKKSGFRWCPSESAWQRHLNNAGIWAAKSFLEDYQGEHEATPQVESNHSPEISGPENTERENPAA